MASWLPKAASAAKFLGSKAVAPLSIGYGLFGNAGKAGISDDEEMRRIQASTGTTGNIEPAPQITQMAPTDGGGGGTSPAPAPIAGGGGGGGQINLGGTTTNKRDDLMRLHNMQTTDIDAEFDDEMTRLGKVKGGVTDRYNASSGLLASYFPQYEGLVNQEKTNQMTALGDLEVQRKNESNNALAQARQMLGDLQRRQTSYLSASGNYGSSVPEALGEQFGRQAFSAIGNVQKQRDTALADISNKRAQAETFYSQKLLTAKQEYDTQQMNLQTQFQAQLDAIDNAKGAASSAKRAATTEAWREYVNAKLTLDNNAAQTQGELSNWFTNLNKNFQQEEASFDQATSQVPGISAPLGMADNIAEFAFGGGQDRNMQSTSQFSPIYTRGAQNPDDILQQLMGGGMTA